MADRLDPRWFRKPLGVPPTLVKPVKRTRPRVADPLAVRLETGKNVTGRPGERERSLAHVMQQPLVNDDNLIEPLDYLGALPTQADDGASPFPRQSYVDPFPREEISTYNPTYAEQGYGGLAKGIVSPLRLGGVSDATINTKEQEVADALRTADSWLLGAGDAEVLGSKLLGREGWGDPDIVDYAELALSAAPTMLRKPLGKLGGLVAPAIRDSRAAKWLTESLGLADEGIDHFARPRYVRTEEPDGSLSVRREDLVPATVPEARDARTLGEIRRVPANPARDMVEASRTLPEGPMPVSSLERQSGIGRAYREAVAGNPEYEHALFERYGELMPDVVEASGAQNYGQLTEAAYNALGEDITRQFDQLPISMRFHDGSHEYATPSAMMRDALGYGNLNAFSGGDPHDMLSRKDPVTGLTLNEMFRPLHDYIGHVAPGSTFRPGGEEIAYATHAATMSPLARLALLSETRGQNSLVNYSPLNAEITGGMNEARLRLRERGIAEQMSRSINDREAEAGRRALRELPPEDDLKAQLRELGSRTQFAEQRGVLLPPEYLDPQSPGGMPGYLRGLIRPDAPTDARGVHISTQPGLETTDPSFYGTGHRGQEYKDVKRGGRPDRTYFYSGPEGTVEPESSVLGYSGVGLPRRGGERHAYEAPLSGLYDMDLDPEGIVGLSKAYNLPDYEPVLSHNDLYAYGATDIGGRSAAPDLERLTGEYGYRGLITDRARPGQRWAEVFDPVTGLRRIERGPQGFADGGRVE